MLKAVLLVAAGLSCSAWADDCDHARFDVKITRTYTEYGYSHLIGTAKNNNPIPCGVEVRYSTYDKAGELMRTKEGWPASVRNIPPGQSEKFDLMIEYDRTSKNVGIETLSAKHWIPR